MAAPFSAVASDAVAGLSIVDLSVDSTFAAVDEETEGVEPEAVVFVRAALVDFDSDAVFAGVAFDVLGFALDGLLADALFERDDDPVRGELGALGDEALLPLAALEPVAASLLAAPFPAVAFRSAVIVVSAFGFFPALGFLPACGFPAPADDELASDLEALVGAAVPVREVFDSPAAFGLRRREDCMEAAGSVRAVRDAF